MQLSSYRGKVVVLNFWATWCAPCIEEIPSLNELQQQCALLVLGVDVGEDESGYRQFLDDTGSTSLPFAMRSSIAMHFTEPRPPETYVIDRNGQIRRKFIGPQDWTSPEIVNYLSHL